MKKALVYQFHGIGDTIILMPCLKKLFDMGYKTTMMCQKQIITSHLLDECPYIDHLIGVPNPWEGDFNAIHKENLDMFNNLAKEYDWSGYSDHLSYNFVESKSEMFARELKLDVTDHTPEVFISEENQSWADKHWPKDRNFLFAHYDIPRHINHNWDECLTWCSKNLIYDDVYDTVDEPQNDDINRTFAVMRNASCIVVCSSVYAHAAEAMDLHVDCINYGTQDRKVLLKHGKVMRIREMGEFLERSNRIFSGGTPSTLSPIVSSEKIQ